MRIAVIGSLEVLTEAASPVVVPGAKERLLLAVLAAGAPGLVSADHLVDALWDGAPPPTARKSLQAHLVRLRSALEPERPRGSPGRYIVRRGAGYALAAGDDEIDALRFGDLVARGRAVLSSGDAAAAAEMLSAALDLWRGEPYADWPDAEFAAVERRRLAEVRAGALTALLEARLALGAHADIVGDLEVILAEDPLREDWWRLLVLALYRCGRQSDALAALQRARRVLATELGADPGPRLRALEAAVLAQDPALEALRDRQSTERSLAPLSPAFGVCPYKGLAAYQAADAALFHGRDRLIARLVARLVDTSLLVVSGPSGVGKSSVVRAGLVPTLAGGALPGSNRWRPLVVTPGRRPVDALTELTGETPPGSPVLLVCDQSEELWAPEVDGAERAAFLDTLLGLLDDGAVIRCIVVIRGDHVELLAEHATFADRLGSGLVLVPALADDELRQVVEEPASAVGLAVATDLVDAVIADVRGRPGALPLLSTALVGTWERRAGSRLTLAGYLAAGGVAAALIRAAEAALATLDEEGQALARRMLVRLADTDERGALVRRAAMLAELDLEGEEGAARRAVVETFVRRRLLALDADRLEVAHESLLTAWPRLARWLEDDATGRAVRRHLSAAAQEWVLRGEPADELYRGARLHAALEWMTDSDLELAGFERRFLQTSHAWATADLVEARRRADHEAAMRRRTRWLAVVLTVVLVIAVVAAGAAVRGERVADDAARAIERQALLADARRLASLSEEAAGVRQAIVFAVAAVRLVRSPETERQLDRALLRDHPRVLRVMPIDPQAGTGLLSGAWDGVFVELEEHGGLDPVETGTWQPQTWAFPEEWIGRRIAMAGSPSQELVAAIGGGAQDGWVGVVDLGGREVFHLAGGRLGGAPMGLGFSRDGRRLVVLHVTASAGAVQWRVSEIDPVSGARQDGVASGPLPSGAQWQADVSPEAATAVLWTTAPGMAPVVVDLAGGGQVALNGDSGAEGATVVGYRATSQGAIQMWDDGRLVLFDRDGRVRQQIHHRHMEAVSVLDAALSPELDWAVTVGEGASVQLWDIDPKGYWKVAEILTGHAGDVADAAIGPDGRLLTVAPNEGAAILWQARGAGPVGPWTGEELVRRACGVVGGLDIYVLDWPRYLPGRPWRPTCSDLV